MSKFNPNILVTPFFILILIVFSLDFGFLSKASRKIKFLFKLYNLLSLIVFLFHYISMTRFIPDISIHFALAVTVFCNFLSILALLLTPRKNTYYQLLKRYRVIDLKLKSDIYRYSKVKLMILIILCFVKEAAYNVSMCWYNLRACSVIPISVLISYCMIGFDVTMIFSSFIFFCATSRVNFLRHSFKSNAVNVPESLAIYKSIGDIVDKFLQVFSFLYTFALLSKTPQLIALTYLRITELQHGISMVTMFKLAHNFISLMLLSSPALCAGVLASESKKLHVTIYDKLLLTREGASELPLEQFGEYVAARPLQLSVMHVIPLDWSLPLAIINLCIAYQIVILQFTHLI